MSARYSAWTAAVTILESRTTWSVMHSTSNLARPYRSTTSASSRSPSLQRECACSSHRRPPPTTLVPCELLMYHMVAEAQRTRGGEGVSKRKRPGNRRVPLHLPHQL